jgi:hypothetical protein
MRADRDKRAIILTAEGQRQAAITSAEGEKAAAILSAEGKKQAAILAAEAERQSRILRAEGERAALFLQAQGQAKSIETVFQAIHDGQPDQALLAYQYLQTLPQIAQGDANKMWIVPSEFSKALEGLAKLTGAEDGAASWLEQTGIDGAAQDGLDTSDWFESVLPAAAEQPEAQNLRASDTDPESIAAHEGMADDTETPSVPPMPSVPPLSKAIHDVAGTAGDEPEDEQGEAPSDPSTGP